MRSAKLTGAFFLGLGLLISLPSSHVAAQEDAETAHIAVKNPAELTHEEANQVYDMLKQSLNDRYAAADLDLIAGYQSWKRYNSAPYLSATHGQRFVNNYANEAAIGYGTLKGKQRYREGTVLAKDSITVTTTGKNYIGAMFVMEKLPAGQNPDTGDWRYVMVLPDGTILGDTIGDEPELVEYCHACHIAKADRDFVFYVPKDYRVTP